jgi:CubicO group peptidase (beta-lactamase class C family)
MLKIILKLAVILFAVVGILFVAVFAALSLFNSPTYAWRVLRYGQSDIADYKIFPNRPILNGLNVSTIEKSIQTIPNVLEYAYLGETHSDALVDFLQRTGTRAFLVVKDDKLIYEKYINSGREDINTSFSSVKSINSALIGAAIADGKIGSVDDAVVKYIPEIAGRGFDQLKIRDLLLMNSGIRYVEGSEMPFYMLPFGDDVITYYPPNLRQVALGVKASDTPVGETFRYNNFHPLLEGLILERVTGMHVAEYLQEKLWRPMGAEFPASWSLDSEKDGFEKMESGFNARAIDFARFGLIFLHNGLWNGEQILPESWVRESTQPLVPDSRTWETDSDWPDYGGYYKYHWWGINNLDGTYDFYAHGHFDQLVYVAPRKNTVIVRLGDRLDDSASWPLALQDLVDKLP